MTKIIIYNEKLKFTLTFLVCHYNVYKRVFEKEFQFAGTLTLYNSNYRRLEFGNMGRNKPHGN